MNGKVLETAIKEASDENTSIKRLKELINTKSGKIRSAVAQNPNTPPDILLKLFDEFPLHVLNNPVFEFLLIENPNFYDELFQVNRDVFNEDGLPSSFLKWGVNHSDESIRIAVAKSPNTPQSFLIELAHDKDKDVRHKVAGNYNTPKEILDKLSDDSTISVRIGVAGNPYTSESVLEKLAVDKDYEVRSKVAAHEKTPMAILEQLAHDRSAIVRLAALDNPLMPIALFNSLLEKIVARNIKIIENYKLPLVFIEWAINHNSENIRIAIANNPHLEENHLARLVEDKAVAVRLAVLKHSEMSNRLLVKLSEDEDQSIGWMAALQLREHLENYYFGDDNPF
jgi:hypothetical protein